VAGRPVWWVLLHQQYKTRKYHVQLKSSRMVAIVKPTPPPTTMNIKLEYNCIQQTKNKVIIGCDVARLWNG
jgi:hypothetical protein